MHYLIHWDDLDKLLTIAKQLIREDQVADSEIIGLEDTVKNVECDVHRQDDEMLRMDEDMNDLEALSLERLSDDQDKDTKTA